MKMNVMKKIEDITIVKNEPMAKHTSWRTGGFARQYVQASSLTTLSECIAQLPADEKLLWLGLGSNTLIRDGGFNGTVIATQGVMTQLEVAENSEDETIIYVGAGVASAKLARFCSRLSLSGAEFFAGIPGLVGGALAMNAGAFGGETWPLVRAVETMNHKGEIKRRDAKEFEYGYRFVNGLNNEWFISATLCLQKNKSNLPDSNILDIKQLLAKRAASQPTGVASCGSVFQNPKAGFAAQLIETCGLKGKRIGGAIVSEKHANFIINENNATATDIEELILFVQKTVKDEHNIELQTEVKIVGDRLNDYKPTRNNPPENTSTSDGLAGEKK